MQTRTPASHGDGSIQTDPILSFTLDIPTQFPTYRKGDQGHTAVPPVTVWGLPKQSWYMSMYNVSYSINIAAFHKIEDCRMHLLIT